VKGDGTVTGAAFIDWNGSYVFEGVEGRVLVQSLDNFQLSEAAPLTGVLRFSARGSGTFDSPRYEMQGTIADLFIGDEGIGQVTAQISVEDEVLTVADLNVTEPRVQLSGGGTIALNEFYDSRLSFRFLNTSIDPYLKFVGPEVSPFTGIIASGRVEVTGALLDVPHLLVNVTVDDARITPLDYEFANDGPVRLILEDHTVRLERMRLRGLNTALELSGRVDLGPRRIDITAEGDADLAILPVFLRGINASGAARVSARLQGPIDEPSLSGEATILDGNIRHFDLPHSLTAINGPIQIANSRIDVSGLRARMGDGDVTFGGAISLRSYRPAEFDVTASGRAMRLRYPEGFTSRVNADLALQGVIATPRLSGTVEVISIDYRPLVDPNAGLFGLAGGAVGGAAAAATAAPVVETGFPLIFDIDIQVPQIPLIQSRTATIDGSANLRFTGTIDRPSLTGRVAIDGGVAFFSGNRYTVRQGSIDFADFPRLDTVFDVEAVTRPRAAGQTFDVTVRLTGTFAELTPTITSDPWLPTTDIWTLLLGGRPDVGSAEQRGLENAAETQARMMQTAGAVLLASPVSDRLASVFQDVLPLETVQVTPVLGNESSLQALDPGARITIGKQVSSRVFLTYQRVLNSTQDEIILLEYDQSDRVSWVLSRNENRTFALDFRIRYVF
jgi:translocation and assembly module TamB